MSQKSISKSITLAITLPGFGSLLPTVLTAFLFLSQSVIPAKPFVSDSSIYYLFGLPVLAWVISFFQNAKFNGNIHIGKNNQQLDTGKNVQTRANWVIIIGFISAIISAVDFYGKGAFRNVTDLAANRDLTFSETQVTGFSYLSYVLAPISFYALILVVYYFEELSRLSVLLLYSIAGLHIAISTVLQSGRLYLISMLLAWFWLSIQRLKLGKKILPSSGLFRFSLIAVLTLSIIIVPLVSIARSTKHDSALFAIEAVSPMVSLSTTLIDVIESENLAFAQVVAEVCTYWTSAVQCFDKLYTFYDVPLDYSSCISPFIARRLSQLNMVPESRQQTEAWSRIAAEFRYYTNNLVSTGFSLQKSFGLTGGALVFLAIVYFMNAIYINSKNNFSIVTEMMCFCIWNFNFGWFQRTVFEDPIFEYTVYWFLFCRLRQYFSKAKKFDIK